MPKHSTKLSSSSAKANTFSILLGIIIIFIVFIASYSYGVMKGSKKILPTPTTSVTKTPNILCTNDLLGITLKVKNGWSCESRNLSQTDGVMLIKSDLYEITIGNTSRDIFCIADPNIFGYNPSCKISEFYSKPHLTLNLYKLDDKNKEIFGMVESAKNTPGSAVPWVWIKYKDMETYELTDTQKINLVQILDTLAD